MAQTTWDARALCHRRCHLSFFLLYIMYNITCIYNKMMLVYKNATKLWKKNTPMAQTARYARRLGSISSSLPSNTLPVVYYVDYNLYVQ